MPSSSVAAMMGYTFGMKTAVSIPDEVFARAERFAKQARRSRSEVYSAAVREYVARHAPEDVTEAMNRVCAEVETRADQLIAAAGRRVLERSEW
jgi:metal-responsive CopG/Arc/MetJ family transcriptional regulator